jgi:2-dehydro-3-deoxyphosphogluconate aldolase / (4S)-4-hydroxy-2-oxoglutarate aldolase
MARYSRLQVYTTILETGLIPLFYHSDAEVAAGVIRACLDGGARCLEFTNRGDGAHLVFAELVNRFKDDPRLVLGAGTVIDAASAALFIQLGANFIIGPSFSPEVARLCNRRMVAYIPGCGTATEISNAQEMGAEICKVFPAEGLGGPGFVKAVRGPLPWSRLMPTGGVEADPENIRSWIDAGVACVGLGSKLIPAKLMASGDFSGLTASVRSILGWIKAARADKPVI